MIRIETVENRTQLREFVRFPLSVYSDGSPWVPPVWRDEMMRLDRARSPFFEHSDAALFLARDASGEPVGRIAAIRFNRHLEVYDDDIGFFGFFECIDDESVSRRLFATVVEWLRGQGLKRVRGPASFTINEEIGLLIENFDEPPTMLTTWNPPYYQRLVELAGFTKVEDLLARELAFADLDVRYLERLAKAGERNGQVTIRPANLAKLETEVEILMKIYAEAWSENWGAVPISHDEFQKLAGDLKPFLLPEYTLIAEYEGVPVGICVAVPDINVALKACGGRLGPLGLLRFLLARRRIDLIRGVVMGVLKAHRNKGIDSAFCSRIAKALMGSRYKRIEFSWMLESNFRVHRVLERTGAKVTKRWRIYEREL